jgi:hypothetical protein
MNEVGKEVSKIILPYLCGSLDTWYSFYDYIDSIVFRLDKTEKFKIVSKLSQFGFIWACNEFCVVSQKPKTINKNKFGLHCENGPSLEYAGVGGLKMYHLNGVSVPEYLVMTDSEKLDLDFYKNEKNADVKAEFIRKFGISRMTRMGKVIDTWEAYKENYWWVKSEYELIDMSPIFTKVPYAPHLKMKNQTTGIYHLEGVDPKCKNLEEAMAFRNNGNQNLQTFNIK